MEHTLSFCVTSFARNEYENLDSFKSELRKFLQIHCGFSITTLDNYVNTSENNMSSCIPTFLQQVMTSLEITGNFHLSFRNFIPLWMSKCSSYFLEQFYPWLVINDRRAFTYSRDNNNELKVQRISFGTLVSSSHFIIHGEMTGTPCFFHDIRCLKIWYQFGSKILVLSYAQIRFIIVNDKDLLLVYTNPPIVRDFNETNRENSDPVNRDLLGLSNGILFNSISRHDRENLISRLNFRCFQLPVIFVPFVCSNTTILERGEVLLRQHVTGINFNCMYLMEALVRQKFLLQLQGIRNFAITVRHLYLEQPEITEEALSDLILVMELGYPLNLSTTLMKWFDCLKNRESKDRLSMFVPDHTRLIRRLVLTPTRVLLYPKEIIIENRILRNFNPDFALRVSFRDDDFAKLSIRLPLSESINSSTIYQPMVQGLEIAGRKYEFLAWSNSQIRDHSVWMYARDEKNNTAESIRQWMGDFSGIKVVAKHMARMGQCFSQTTETIGIPLTSQHVKEERDIEGGFDQETWKPYCFSDGIGRISEETVKEVCDILDLKPKPSAFQIRYGGFKGMVVTDPTLKDKRIVFRDSMKKFNSRSDTLEIVKHSTPGKVALNRPLIAILQHLKIDTGVFLRIQEDALQTLTEMLLDSGKAASYLAHHNNLRGVDLVDAYNCGIDLASEPFFRKMLLARHEHDITGIRQKARLPIDPSEGRNMFGVLDETRTLEYGQVFVQYTTEILVDEFTKKVSKKISDRTTILRGDVLVTKNPCYLPGDVRILNCVDVPALHHIVDCIVFPQLGARPHPNELSGSDLDGDEYTVIWKKSLLFPRNAAPGQFPSPRGAELPYAITVAHMVKFLQEFINNDRIGFIASSHLATSDMKGVGSPDSVRIARYCSIAVDFPKTGVPVNLDKNLRPMKYPDFMERGYRESYQSKRSLGKLFRVCRDFQGAYRAKSSHYENIKVDPDFMYPGWEGYQTQAESTLTSYQNCMLQVLGTYGVKHESEALSGAFSAIHSRFKESKDRYETEELVAVYIRALWKKFKNDFWSELQEHQNCPTEVLKKVSAYYVVTYSQENPVVLSLPWIFTRQLSQMKQLRLAERRQPLKPSVSPLLVKMNMELEILLDSFLFNLFFNDIYQAPSFHANNYKTLRNANAVVLRWAEKVSLVHTHGARGPKKGFMERNSVTKLLMHVARKESRDDGVMPLVLKFLRFCISFRFLSGPQRNQILPFPLPQSGYVSKEAMLTYRNLAVSADLSCLNIGDMPQETEPMEMEPIMVQIRSIGSNTEQLCTLLVAESGAEQVTIRKEGKWKYVINAVGKASSLQRLESILRKGDQYLQSIAMLGHLT